MLANRLFLTGQSMTIWKKYNTIESDTYGTSVSINSVSTSITMSQLYSGYTVVSSSVNGYPSNVLQGSGTFYGTPTTGQSGWAIFGTYAYYGIWTNTSGSMNVSQQASLSVVNRYYDKGTYITDVSSVNPNAYPNGYNSADGYYYVRQ